MAFEKIETPTVRESFVRKIENMIISGELKQGDKLPPAKELCSMMGVSLTVVNAGMSELVSKGFIDTVPRRGSYVADYRSRGNADTFVSIMRYNGGTLTENDVRSFIETRMAIDPFVAELVVERASDKEIDSLLPIIEQMRCTEDFRELCELVTGYYHRLTLISGNSFMSMLYNSTKEPQACVYRMYFEKNGVETTISTCKMLHRLLKDRDSDSAKELMLTALKTALKGPMAVV